MTEMIDNNNTPAQIALPCEHHTSVEDVQHAAAPTCGLWLDVPPEVKKKVDGLRTDILGFLKDRTKMALEIGERLNRVKEILPKPKFGQWLKSELGGLRSAQRYMLIARSFEGHFDKVKVLPKGILIGLCSKRVSKDVRGKVIEFCKGKTADQRSEAITFARDLLVNSKNSVSSRPTQLSEPESYDRYLVLDLAALVADVAGNGSRRLIDVLVRLGLPVLASNVAQSVSLPPTSDITN